MNISTYHATLTGNSTPIRLEHWDDGINSKYCILGTRLFMEHAEFCVLRSYCHANGGRCLKFGRRSGAVSCKADKKLTLNFDSHDRLIDPREQVEFDPKLSQESPFTAMFYAQRKTKLIFRRLGLKSALDIDIWR